MAHGIAGAHGTWHRGCTCNLLNFKILIFISHQRKCHGRECFGVGKCVMIDGGVGDDALDCAHMISVYIKKKYIKKNVRFYLLNNIIYSHTKAQ